MNVNGKWRAACRMMLGCETGELSRYETWLSSYMGEHRIERLESGREAMYQFENFPQNARKIDFDNVNFMKEHRPLSAREVKDIDSIVQAIRERVAYAGNIVLGNSRFAEKSTNVFDSTFVYKSAGVSQSSYIAYATDTRLSKMVFGGDQNAQSEHLIGSFINRKANRCLESWAGDEVSDVYYSSYCQGCSECMFCFNAKNLRYAIGNAQYPREEYLRVKGLLLSELNAELEKTGGVKRSIFSLGGDG